MICIDQNPIVIMYSTKVMSRIICEWFTLFFPKWAVIEKIKSYPFQRKNTNKKVLLREHKTHTDRGVSSTTRDEVPPVRVPPRPGLMGGTRGGVPPVRYPHRGTPWPGPMGGTRGGVPPSEYPPVGYPHQGTPLGYPLARSNRGYPRWGIPHRVSPIGVPPPPGTGWIPPPPRCGQTESSPGRHVPKHNLPSYYVRGR